jgi:hypothetical protein
LADWSRDLQLWDHNKDTFGRAWQMAAGSNDGMCQDSAKLPTKTKLPLIVSFMQESFCAQHVQPRNCSIPPAM